MLIEAIHSGSAHWLDCLVALSTGKRRLFFHGWGDEGTITNIAEIVRFDAAPRSIAVAWDRPRRAGTVESTDGAFASPAPGLPEATRRAFVRRLAPAGAPSRSRPVYVVLASSGDEGFDTRARLWRPLVERGSCEVVLLENPYYGRRRPPGQQGPNLRTVSDHVRMTVAMVEEGRSLVASLVDEGRERVGVAGFSMGGSMAAVIAAVTPLPMAVAVVAAGRSAVPVFTEGLLSRGVDFPALGGEPGRARMREVFSTADLDRHPVPLRPEAAVLVGARHDAYVFPSQVAALHAHWAGSELRWVDTGHAGAILRHGEALRRAAVDAMARLGGGACGDGGRDLGTRSGT